jgi:hypothetical protein
LAYEIAEFFVVREDKACFIGDIVEFCIGYAVIGLLCEFAGWWVCAVRMVGLSLIATEVI